MKINFKYLIFVILLFTLFFFVYFSSLGLLYYKLNEGKKFDFLGNLVKVLSVSTYSFFKTTLENVEYSTLNDVKLQNVRNFNKNIQNSSNSSLLKDKLIIIPRYSDELKRSIIELRELSSLKLIHNWSLDFSSIDKLVNKEKILTLSEVNYNPKNPYVFNDGSIYVKKNGPLFRFDICGNLLSYNDKYDFFHTINKNNQGNLIVSARSKTKSKLINFLSEDKPFRDDHIVELSFENKILKSYSLTDIFLNNDMHSYVFGNSEFFMTDPFHINDIEQVSENSEVLKKDDYILALGNMSKILVFRPSTGKIIDLIDGPFSNPHDINILSPSKISFINNNTFRASNSNKVLTNSEILFYDFKTKKFRKKFNNILKEINIKIISNGFHHILDNGSLVIQDVLNGRIFLINTDEKIEWEFTNNNISGEVFDISHPRIIEDINLITDLRNIILKKTC